MDYIDIHNEASAKAQQAVDETIRQYGNDNAAFNYCGFAWVTIPTKRQFQEERRFRDVLKAANIGSDGISSGWRISAYDMVDLSPKHSQSMELKEIAARTYCEVLQSYGLVVAMSSRAD